ncbi:MAG: P1 family peptidase [Firmicutes bacterium]|nr:P1 family peptidase [Bacillota bacterium]
MSVVKRLRDYGIKPGYLQPGPDNAITDVPGVGVGHCTLMAGKEIRTGVTAILPHYGNLFVEKVPAAVEIINGFGKAAGLSQIMELGELETPVLLTNTLSVGSVLDALVSYKLERNPEIGRKQPTVNGVVLECNDGYLNDIRARKVSAEHVRAALAAASRERPAEGSVGAGTGMTSFGCKGGIGNSSRIAGDYICGVLVLSNFGRWHQLKIDGLPVGQLLANPGPEEQEKGSIVMVVATNAPLDARQLRRVARRAGFGLARTGSVAGNGSGDFALAFSIGVKYTEGGKTRDVTVFRDSELDLLFEAVVEATEEAILNALFTAGSMEGRDGHFRPALPIKEVLTLLSKCGNA